MNADVIAINENPHIINTVACAVCGKLRGPNNHWYVVIADEAVGFLARLYPTDRILMTLEMPVCGQQCAQKKLEGWLNQQRGVR